MREFRVNKYIALKLENNRTYIYINNKRFIQCIRLVLKIPIDDILEYEQINSIDEAAELNKTLLNNRIVTGRFAKPDNDTVHTITPEEEFIAHCSNIQAWVENNYDTRVLHSNISFPLLKELTKAGDPDAKRVLKEEIGKRYMSGYYPVKKYLRIQGYLNYLNKDELAAIGASDYIAKPPSKKFHFEDLEEIHQENLAKLAEALLNIKEGKPVVIILPVNLYHNDYRRKMGGGAIA